MLKVRRTLTEILLEVTTEEMTAVAREVYQKARAKGTTFYTTLVFVSKLSFLFGLYMPCRISLNDPQFLKKNGIIIHFSVIKII